MDPIDIQYALKKAGIKQKDLAESLGVSQALISQVINGVAKSNRVQSRLQEILIPTKSKPKQATART